LGMHGVEEQSTTAEALSANELTSVSQSTRSSMGRPKGTTDKDLRNKNEKEKSCLAAVCHRFNEIKNQKIKRMEQNELDRIILETKTEYGLLDFQISPETVRSRVKRQRLNPQHCGTPSPCLGIEDTLVEICLAMSQARQPLTCSEGLALANSLIKDRDIEQAVIAFKRSRHLINDDLEQQVLGRRYWKSFLKRNAHRLHTQKGVKFAKDRSEWSKLSYIKRMYEKIYETYLTANVAKTVQPTYRDMFGKEVPESQRYGEIVTIELTKPSFVLFADETRCNTSQTKDGNCAGEKFICKRGQIPKEKAATSDHHFTYFSLLLLPVILWFVS